LRGDGGLTGSATRLKVLLEELVMTQDSYYVVPAGKRDADGILQLLDDCGLKWGGACSAEAIRKKISHDPGSVVVLVVNDQVRGCVFFNYDPMYTMVYHLAVAEQFRRQGWAEELLEAARATIASRGGTACRGSYIAADNCRSLALAKKHGYATYPAPLVLVHQSE
jgi:ribosomal protein S18 acetylase RimI-like enzyme